MPARQRERERESERESERERERCARRTHSVPSRQRARGYRAESSLWSDQCASEQPSSATNTSPVNAAIPALLPPSCHWPLDGMLSGCSPIPPRPVCRSLRADCLPALVEVPGPTVAREGQNEQAPCGHAAGQCLARAPTRTRCLRLTESAFCCAAGAPRDRRPSGPSALPLKTPRGSRMAACVTPAPPGGETMGETRGNSGETTESERAKQSRQRGRGCKGALGAGGG